MAFGSIQAETLMAASHAVPSVELEEEQCLVEVIRIVDELYCSNKMKEALAYLEKYSESEETEILWRLARLCYKV